MSNNQASRRLVQNDDEHTPEGLIHCHHEISVFLEEGRAAKSPAMQHRTAVKEIASAKAKDDSE